MAWWLLDSVINGTLDEDYPIMSKKNEDDVVILGGESSDTITFTSDGVGAADTVSLDQSFWDEDGFSITGNPFAGGNDSISFRTDGYPGNLKDSSLYGAAYDPISFGKADEGTLQLGDHLPGGMGEDHISFSIDPGLAHTAYDDPKYYSDINGLIAGDIDDVYAYHYPGTDKKPKPDLKGPSHHKYQEDKGIKDLQDYVSSTYKGHYTNENSDTQTLDLIHSVGDAESFCRSNAIKYLSRYDKKGSAKNDILKAMHYCLLLYYFSGNTKEPDYTNTRYETF